MKLVFFIFSDITCSELEEGQHPFSENFVLSLNDELPFKKTT